MLKKYNIALLPRGGFAKFFELSQRLSSLSAGYLLGEKSLPHVTLLQFFLEEEHLDSLWKSLSNTSLNRHLELTFSELSFFTYDTLSWISLLPNHCNLLAEMHEIVKSVVSAGHTRPYDPHLTLTNTNNLDYAPLAGKLLMPLPSLSDTFILSLGECDSAGQFTKLLFQYEIT